MPVLQSTPVPTPTAVPEWFPQPTLDEQIFSIVGSLVSIAVFVVLVIIAVKVYRAGQRRARRNMTIHGTARWAQPGEGGYGVNPRSQGTQGQLVLGMYQGTMVALSEVQQQSHVLIVGPTGQGKTAQVIIPGLLNEPGTRSLFVIDPKNELVAKTAGAVSQRHRCWFFAPTQPQQSHYYNPLAHIRTMEDAQDFAACWVANTGKSRDPFWDRNTELLITAAVLHLRETEPDAPLSRLADLLAGQSYQQIRALFAGSPSRVARDIGNSFLQTLAMHEHLAAGILTGIGGRFFMLRSPNLETVTSRNELDFAAMIDRPTALYLSIPASAADRLRPLSACLTMQMFATWLTRAEQSPGNMLPRAVACYLDEFANAGYIPHMTQWISMLRSTRVALILAIQDFAQLDKVYGQEDRKTILANATTHLVLPGVGQDEAKHYSERCGDTTVMQKSKTWGGRSAFDVRVTNTPVRRRLINPDEIRTMPKGCMLMVADSAPPMIINGLPYYAVPALAERARLPYQLPAPRQQPPVQPTP